MFWNNSNLKEYDEKWSLNFEEKSNYKKNIWNESMFFIKKKLFLDN